MSEFDIFKAVPNLDGGEFFPFKEIGAMIQGTYIGKKHGVNNYGDPQTTYVLKDSNGKIWSAGFRDAQTTLHKYMSAVQLGQIVGFKFETKIPSTGKPGKFTHIIKPYADPKYVDQKWLDEQAQIEREARSALGGIIAATTPDNFMASVVADEERASIPVPVLSQNNDALNAIFSMAVNKGIVPAGTDQATAREKIEKFAELPLLDEHLASIIIKISAFKNV